MSALTRRSAMLASGAAALASSARGSQAASSDPMAIPRELDTQDPDHNLIAYMKIMSDLSGKPTFRYHRGRILSVLGRNVGEPLMDFVACKQDRVRRLTDGSYQHGYRGVILFTELDTGRVLETFDNPITGKTNTVNHFKTAWGSGVFTPLNGPYSLSALSASQEAVGLDGEPFTVDWDINGDDVWITYDERVVVRNPDDTVAYADSSMYRYHASLEQLQDPRQTSAEAIMSWDTETTWWPWMNMDNVEGHMIFGSMGRKYNDIGDVPKEVITASERIYPGQLTRPIDWADYTLPDPALEP